MEKSDMIICDAEAYHSQKMQKFMQQDRKEKAWIFNILKTDIPGETVYVRTPEWILCLDKHYGADTRYLIIFTDKSLKTIRDLRAEHIPMLTSMNKQVKLWLHKHAPQENWEFYFHYMPSVFQLHLHVNTDRAMRNPDRIHPLHVVIKNIRQNADYYSKALILTKMCKTVKRMQSHRKITWAI